MTWKELLEQRRVAREKPARAEIEAQRKLAAVAIADSQIEALSLDGRFDRAYDAARALAIVVVRACGYRVKTATGGHYNTFLALEAADPVRFAQFSAYFNLCREKRNQLSYVSASAVSRTELDEILREVPRFRELVDRWVRDNHAELA